MLAIPWHITCLLAPRVVLQQDFFYDFLMHQTKSEQSAAPQILPFLSFLKMHPTLIFLESFKTFPDHQNLSKELENNLTRTPSSSFRTLQYSLLSLYTFDWTGLDHTVLVYMERWSVWWLLSTGSINLCALPQQCSYLLLRPETYLLHVICILLLCATCMVWIHFSGFSFTIQGAASLRKKPSMSFCSVAMFLIRPNCGAQWLFCRTGIGLSTLNLSCYCCSSLF